jgi:methyltransferase-like protein 27
MAPDDSSIGDWLSADPSDPALVADRYDSWAGSYDGDLAAWDYRAPVTVVGTVLTLRPDVGSVLDVGCGTGLVGRTFRSRGFAGRLDGLDLSQESLDAAGRAGGYDSLTRADLQQALPIADDSADAVVCVGVMTYLPDVQGIWSELARVTRPGGLVVVTQREDLWVERECQAVIDRLQQEGAWKPLHVDGPSPYLPDGYGGTPEVACYYLSARVT